jgi:hypothetical protein
MTKSCWGWSYPTVLRDQTGRFDASNDEGIASSSRCSAEQCSVSQNPTENVS